MLEKSKRKNNLLFSLSEKGRHLGAVLGLGKGRKNIKTGDKIRQKTFPRPFIYFFVKFLTSKKI